MSSTMDSRLLLVKSVTLLYRESLISDKSENSADLVRTVLEEIKLPEISLSLNHEREHLMALKDTALYLCSLPLDQQIEKDDLLQRLKVNCDNDEKLYEAFEQGIVKDMDEASLKRTVLSIRKSINDMFRENELVKCIDQAYGDLHFRRSSIKSIQSYVTELATKLEPYQIGASRKDPGVVNSLDIGDTSSLDEVFTKVKEVAEAVSILLTGWKGLNRALQGGFRRGETWVFGALQHSYKTGFSLTIFKQLAIYNKPVMKNTAKKPLMLRISFEDSLQLNMQFLYQNFYENEFGKKANLKDVTPGQMTAYVQKKLQVQGYHVKMMRVNPSEWTYKDVQNTVLELEANGYEIHCLMLDYLPMLPTTGCESGPAGHDIRDMYRRMRNFCAPRDILLITPHQLSTDAKNLIREGSRDLVKKIAGGGYYSGSKQIDQEVDGELYLHIEKLNGRAYLTVQRGKHRIPTIIPDTEKYFVLPFPEDGSIPDDLLLDHEITLKVVGGGPIGTKEAIPFWEYEQV